LVSVQALRVISKFMLGSTQFDHFNHCSLLGVIIDMPAGAVLSKTIVEASDSEFVFVARSSIEILIEITQSGSPDVMLRL